jgi:Dpy-30 motif
MQLCKEKPSGNDAIKWLGEWLIENNPNKPMVEDPED